MLRVALLLTGELRTLQETHKSILLNLIEPNMADVFIHYAQQSYKEKNSVFDPSTFGKLWGQEAVKKVACWSAADDKEHEFYRQQVAQVKPCTSKLTANRNYLLYGSGTLYISTTRPCVGKRIIAVPIWALLVSCFICDTMMPLFVATVMPFSWHVIRPCRWMCNAKQTLFLACSVSWIAL